MASKNVTKVVILLIVTAEVLVSEGTDNRGKANRSGPIPPGQWAVSQENHYLVYRDGKVRVTMVLTYSLGTEKNLSGGYKSIADRSTMKRVSVIDVHGVSSHQEWRNDDGWLFVKFKFGGELQGPLTRTVTIIYEIGIGVCRSSEDQSQYLYIPWTAFWGSVQVTGSGFSIEFAEEPDTERKLCFAWGAGPSHYGYCHCEARVTENGLRDPSRRYCHRGSGTALMKESRGWEYKNSSLLGEPYFFWDETLSTSNNCVLDSGVVPGEPQGESLGEKYGDGMIEFGMIGSVGILCLCCYKAGCCKGCRGGKHGGGGSGRWHLLPGHRGPMGPGSDGPGAGTGADGGGPGGCGGGG